MRVRVSARLKKVLGKRGSRGALRRGLLVRCDREPPSASIHLSGCITAQLIISTFTGSPPVSEIQTSFSHLPPPPLSPDLYQPFQISLFLSLSLFFPSCFICVMPCVRSRVKMVFRCGFIPAG